MLCNFIKVINPHFIILCTYTS